MALTVEDLDLSQWQDPGASFDVLWHTFRYLGVEDLSRASRVCQAWRDVALLRSLWRRVTVTTSIRQVWSFCSMLTRQRTRSLSMRELEDHCSIAWEDMVEALGMVDSLEELHLPYIHSPCLEHITSSCTWLKSLSACLASPVAVEKLTACLNLTELRLKGAEGPISLVKLNNVQALSHLKQLRSLALTKMYDDENVRAVLQVLPHLTQLETLELGDMSTDTTWELGNNGALAGLSLRRLTLEQPLWFEDLPMTEQNFFVFTILHGAHGRTIVRHIRHLERRRLCIKRRFEVNWLLDPVWLEKIFASCPQMEELTLHSYKASGYGLPD